MEENHRIKSIKAREILDSRGSPTIEVEVKTNSGAFRASVPSGASIGKYEAVELRDGGKRYFGKGVLKAIRNINEIIAPKLIGREVEFQKEIDNSMIELDKTDNKSNLGANAICGVSLAVCRAGAAAKNLKLFQYIKEISNANYKIPTPLFNIINGGVHAGNDLDFQEFMIVPQVGGPFSERLRAASEIYHQLKNILLKKYGNQATNLGDEGGFAPPVIFPEEAIDLILRAAKDADYGDKIKIILDVAASQFLEVKKDDKRGQLENKYKMKAGVFTREGLIRYYSNLVSKYPIIGLEDPFSEDDWKGWTELSSRLKIQNSKFLIIGDDLLATNVKKIKEAKEKGAVNSMILKINQVGTVSEAIDAARTARDFNWKIIVSHRSGETNDSFISDFAVGIGADFIKTGAPARGERVEKYNRLLEIEKDLSGKPTIIP